MFKRISKIVFLFMLMAAVTFAEAVKIDIVTFNDFHGNVAEDARQKGKNIGMAKMVGYVNEVRAENPNTVVVSAGDNYQGTAISNLTYGEPVTDMMRAMKVVASAVGNHEFDWGAERIEKWAKSGNFDYLACNIYDKTTGKPVSWAKPYKIVEVAGIKLAFIGLATEQTAYSTKAEFVKNLEFKKSDVAAKMWVDFLKAGKAPEGTPDLIIALTHVPSFQDRDTKLITGEELSRVTAVKGLDAIITGHSHKTVAGKLNGISVVQAYKYGRALGRLTITVDENGNKNIVPYVDNVYKRKSDIIADDKANTELVKRETELKPILGKVIGKLDKEMSHDRSGKNLSELGYWSADAMRKATGVQIGLTNGGGLRRSLYAGDITMGDMYEIMPFDNQLVTMKVTGALLKKLIDHGIEASFMTDGQFAGLYVAYDPSKPYEHRVIKLYLENGTPVNDNEYYTLVTNDFVVTGGDKYDFKGAQKVVDTYEQIRDVLVNKIKKEGTVKVPDIGGIIVAMKEYKIQRGEILGRIAKKYDIKVSDLAEVNGIVNPDLIYAGTEIYVPAR